MHKPLPVRQGLGIDVSKDHLQLAISNLEADGHLRVRASKKVANNAGGWKQLGSWLLKHRVVDVPLFIVLEATGIYHEGVTYYLHGQGYAVSVIIAQQAKAFAKSLNLRSKTDALDAAMLAKMAAERRLAAWQPPQASLRRLKRLCRERIALQDQRTIAQNQAHARAHSDMPEADSRRRGKALIKLLTKQIEEIEATLEQTLAADPELARKVHQICQVKGLGLLTVVTILAETDGFALFRRKSQLVCFAGYDVVLKDSGQVNSPGRISHQGNRYIRRALHFPALTAVRYEQNFGDLFDRVRQRTAIPMKAYVAVQRKLLVLIYTLYKNDTPYDPAYATKQAKKNRQELLPA